MEGLIILIGLALFVVVGLLISWAKSSEPSTPEEDYESEIYWRKKYHEKEWKD